MSEQTNQQAASTEATDAAQQPQEALPQAQDTASGTEPQETAQGQQDDAQQDQDDQGSPNAEAKKYRVRLRETEAELETAQQTVANLQRTLAEAALENHLSQPGDLWEIGEQNVGDFFSDDGELDQGRLTEAARQLTKSRPGLSTTDRQYFPQLGNKPGKGSRTSFEDAFKPDAYW